LAGPPAEPGTVHLVGAGPGDPGLLTLRAVRLLSTADLIAWDRLTPPEALDVARPDAELVCVGKRKGQASWAQEDINAMLVAAARAGRSVVRLKGGDPFVFGRGGEEALACRDAGVPFEVVSGVTSAIASATSAGVPVTHRGLSASVTFVSGHEDPDKPESLLNWASLASTRGTIVFLMGATRVGHIAGMLLSHGADPDTPAVMVRWATTDQQRVVRSTLADIADAVRAADLRPPATLVIGEVASLHDVLGDPDEAASIGSRLRVDQSRG
jgi:uroporphyrinogen III methyltransferase/synthase